MSNLERLVLDIPLQGKVHLIRVGDVAETTGLYKHICYTCREATRVESM